MVVGEFTQETDVVVIGGGPAGYTAAFRAAELGQRVTIVDDRPELGGVCLHEGCVPSKTLLHVAERIHSASGAEALGVAFQPPTIDIDRVREWVDQSVQTLARGLTSLCRKRGVEHIHGRARFADSRNIDVTDGPVPGNIRLRFRRAVIATGARPVALPDHPFDGTRIITPHKAVRLKSVPQTLLVVGDSYPAIEIADAYAALGSTVTLATTSNAFLPGADADLIRPLMRALKGRLNDIQTNATLDPGTYDRTVVAVGFEANTDQLALDRTSVRLDESGFVTVDEFLKTTDPRICAIGDVTGPPMLANRAIQQGRIAAEVIAGWSSAYEPQTVANVVFTDPNVAWCGETEASAKAAGRTIRVKKIPWGASGRAVGMNKAAEGMTKIITEPDTGLVLGVGITGPHAAEMIGEGALAVEMGAVADDIAATLHPHPSMCELLGDAARNAVDAPQD